MDIATIIAFIFLVFPSFVTPGPNNLMLMASGAKFGVRRTLPHMAGINIGFPVMLFLVGLGLGELFTAYPLVKTVMKYLAAAYFMWMAWHLVGLRIGEQKDRSRPMRFFEAAMFQWVNPKAWAISVSFISAFILTGEAKLTSLLLISLGCLLLGPIASFLWLYSGRQLQVFLKKTGGEKYLGAIMALLMLVAVVLFLI